MRAALVSLLAVCVLGGAGWLLWFRTAEPPVEAQAETPGTKGAPEPLVVARRPVQDPVASPRVDGLAGVDARWVQINNKATLLLGDGELRRAVDPPNQG